MWEVKLIPTTIVGKPAMAIVLGSVLIAEPDAKRGVYWGHYDNAYAVIHVGEMEELVGLIRNLNAYQGNEEVRIKLSLRMNYFGFTQKLRDFWFDYWTKKVAKPA